MRRRPSPSWLVPLLVLAVPPAAPAAAVEVPPQEMLQLRDPFRRPELKAQAAPKSELERYSTDQFKVLGVATGPDRLRAMLADPTGKTHFVSERTKIGTRRGVITRITPEYIRVRERIVNVLGQEEDVDTDILLPRGSR